MNQAHEVHPLIALVEAVEAADKAARIRVAGAHALTGDRLDAVAIWWREDPAAVDVLLDRIGEAISKTFAERLAGHIRARAKEQTAKRGPRLVTPEDSAPEPAPPGLESYDIPPGYLVTAGGVWSLKDTPEGPVPARLTWGPVVVSRTLTDADTEAVHVEVSWLSDGHWTRRVVPRSTIADPRALVSLADAGAPVQAPTARGTCGWLAAWEAVNRDALPRAWVASRMGWHRGAFLAGVDVVGESTWPLVFGADPGGAQLAAAYRQRGTWDGWREAVEEVRGYPLVMLALYASLAAPLVGLLDLDGFIVDFSAKTSRGKTTALIAAASAWGDPKPGELVRTWAATRASIEALAAVSCHLPVILDESTHLAKLRDNPAEDTIYMLANGQSKGRATLTGMRAARWWRTVTISSGETRLTDYATQEGTRARVLCLTGAPLGKRGAERSERLVSLLSSHHGHAGRKWVALLQREGVATVRARYDSILADMSDPANLPNHLARRLAKHAAALATVASYLHGEMGLAMPDPDPLAELWRQVCADSPEQDAAAAAMRTVWTETLSRASSFYGFEGEGRLSPSGGWLGAWEGGDGWVALTWYRDRIEEALRRGGHEPNAMLRQWRERGWLVTHGDTVTAQARIGGQRVRAIVIRRNAIEEVNGGGK